MSNADIGRSHALNAPRALKHFEGYGYRFNRQCSNWVGQTSSKKNQAPSCFAWENKCFGLPVGEFYQSMSQTEFSFDYFTVHAQDGLEADRCNKDAATVKLETVDDSNVSRTTQYDVCSRRLSVMCVKGRPVREGLRDRGYESFIDSNDPPNMIVVFEDSNHDKSILELPIYTSQGSYEIPAEKHAYEASSKCIQSIINHLVDNWKKLFEVATAHNLRLVSTLLLV